MAESPAVVPQTPMNLIDTATRFLAQLPLGGRNGLILAIGTTLLALTVMIWFATRPAYKMLFSGLPQEETGRIIEQLNKMKVPYQIGPGGTSVDVPADRVYDLRLELATQGLPKQGSNGVGFELFDKSNLVGMTDFMQRMNYQRALQGELARTVESISAVHSARVHLVMPKPSLFVTESKPATASVIMELSRPLQPKQVEGIVHLVATAVEGLEESHVTLLDGKGNLIAGGKGSPKDGRLGADETLTMQQQVEKSLEDRAQAMLDKVIGISPSGVSRSIVRITAELDLSRTERQEEIYDPAGQGGVPRSEQSVNESSRGDFGVGGTPGVRANDANDTAKSSTGGSTQSRNTERDTINYEISKTINKTLLPVGTIKRLSVAVLVDTPEESNTGEKTGNKKRSDEEMTRLQKIVERAVGFDQKRGDTIEMSSVPFERVPTAEDTAPRFWQSADFWLQFLLGSAILALLILVLKPMIEEFLTGERMAESTGIPAAVAELDQQLVAEGVGALPSEEPMRLRTPDRSIKLAQQMINDNPEEAREIIRSWMAQD
ncbi:MAG: flagellar M-ring protein FliF [Magnetococcales bacterium]|nr:flagellar M-ring protein FliF [Magnetococcales bacterium]